MVARSIADRAAVVGAGCTRFGEHFDLGPDELIRAAVGEALEAAGVGISAVDACVLGTAQSAMSGMAFAKAMGVSGMPVTRVENMCATGSDALRQAAYAVTSGAYDAVLACGVEKVKDGGYQGLNAFPIPGDGTARTLTAAAMFSMVVPAYGRKYGVADDQLRDVLSRIASKNHANGVLNPKAQFRRAVTPEAISAMAPVAGCLTVYDCAGVADGAAAALVVRADDAASYTGAPVYIKALSVATGDGRGLADPTYDYTSFAECETAAAGAYAQAGITDPRSALDLAEVHDCFTPTELILYEDLGFAARGTGWKEVLAGSFERGGDLPVNPDGGLKSFGHPTGASGLRMLYEVWLQLREEAGERQVPIRTGLGLTHNLGGYPGDMLSFVGVFGRERG